MALKPKVENFCRQFVVDFNGTQAAIRAGYSKKTANEQAARLLANVSVQQFIAELQKKVADKLEVTAERVVAEYAKLAYANVADTMKEGMTFEDITKLDKNVSAAIESVTVVQTETKTGKSTSVKLKMHSKTAALDALGRHTGIFEKDNAQKVELFKAFLGVDMDKV